MRCPQCRQENPAGARFCLQCGRSLRADCPSCGQPLLEGATFCVQCGTAVVRSTATVVGAPSPASYTPRHLAEKILASRSAIEGERKPVTVLFCDMVSSTALAGQLGPEGMHSLLSRFFETALQEVHRYEGTINQFLGDGFMALFGAPLAHEDHARRAVLAALDIRRVLNDRPPRVESGRPVTVSLRLGLHTGFVVVGAIGDNLRMDYTAVGDTTHLAARLQQMAEPGAIVISEATARLVRGYVALEPRGTVEVRGRSTPVTIHLVTGPGTRRSPLEGPDARRLSHFVGRSRELDALRDLLAEVEAARGQAVGIVGEPGVGKSRLLLEFRRAMAGRRVTCLEGRCLSFGSAIPFGPVLEVVRSACGLTEGDPPETMIEKVQVTLAEVGMDAPACTPFLLHLLGVKETSATAEPLAGLSPEVIKTRTFEILRQMSLRTGRRRPLVVAVEDLHWIDRTSEEYVASLVESLAGAPIMLLTTYRPGYRPAWLDKSYATQLSLARLTPTDSLSVVRSVLPDAGLGDPLAKLILDKAEGNPFFLEELARAIGDQGLPRPGLTVPDTVHVVLTARIDRLAEQPKRLLQTASVLGREFSVRLLEAVWDGGPLDPHLQVLTRQEFVYERSGAEDAVYVFKHALTQDVAEATILAPRRRELHLRAAQALAALDPDRPGELAPMLAHHYFQAEAWPLACEHATRAAEAASAVYANKEALERYDQALTAGERAGLAPECMRLHAARGRVHGTLGAFEAARADLEAALAMARIAGDAGACSDLLGALGELWGGHRDYQRGLELTLEAAQTAEAAGDRRLLAEALVRTGLMHLNLARINESERGLERALAIFEDLADEQGCARTLDVLNATFSIGGRVERGIAHGRDALRRFQALGNRTAQTSVIGNTALWLALSGQRRESETLALQGLRAAVDLGARSDEAYAQAGLGWLFELYGEYGPALRESTTALALARQLGHREWTALGLSLRGRIIRLCGDPAQARVLHEEMLVIARELGTMLWIAGALAELGEDRLAVGDDDGGLGLLEEAVATAGEAVQFTVPPRLAHADLLLRQRRLEAARDTARRVQEAAREFVPWAIEGARIEGEALVGLGRGAAGEHLLRDTKAKAQALGVAPAAWRAALGLADSLTERQRHDEASAERAEARALLERAAAELPEDLRRTFAATPAMRRAQG